MKNAEFFVLACLDIIKPTLDSDSDIVQVEVFSYFSDMERSKSIKISNYVRARHAYLKILKPKEIGKLSLHKEGVFMFLDVSNLWITAKYTARDSHLITNCDPRIRLDMGNLIKVILNDRQLLQCNIYGSVPPSRDSFWKMYEELGAEVFSLERSKVTKTTLTADMVITASKHLKSPFHMIMAVGSGDLDILPPIETVINNYKADVELWSWKKSLSSTMLEYSHRHFNRMTANYLDSYFL